MRTYGLIYKDTKTEEEEHIDGDATNHEIDTKDEIMDCSDETETVGAAEEPPLYSLEEFLKGRCQFRCLICSFTTSSTDLLWGHVSKIHSVSMEKYKATHGSAYIVKSVKIECVICFRHVRHEPGSWGQHCLSEHGLGLEKFFRKYYCSADKAERPVHGEGDCGLDLAEDDDVDHGFSVWWASGNKYGCKICGKECTNVHSMYQHLQSQHKMNAGDYRAAHGDLLTKVEQFKCQYCQESLNFDRRMVTSHLAKHKISPKDYFKYYLNMEGLSKSRLFHEWQYGCEYHCRICKKKIMTYGLLENHLSADHGGIGVAEYEKCYGPMMFREVKKPCAICNAELVWYPLKVKQHLKTHGCSLAIYYYKYVESMDGGEEFEAWKRDGNLFTCKVCRKTTSVSQSLANHITRDHGMSRKDYVKQYGAIRTESGVHKCVICSKEMLFDLGIIRQHVSGKHSTTLREYFMKHVKKLLRQQCDEDKVTETFEEWKKGGVVYQCRDCEKTVRSKNGFLYHIRTIHELSEDEYRLIHGNQLYEPVDHVCKVCGASVDFDPSNALPAHLINRHKLSVREYFERHVANKTKTFVSPKKNNSTINPGSKQLNRSEDEEFQKWKNQCGYNCKVCGLKYVTAFGLKTHLEVKHKLSLEEYRAKHGPVIMTNVVKKKCPVPACNKTILYQAQKLKNHLLLQHALELRDCFRQHVENKLGGETTAGGGDGSDSLQHPEKDMTFLEWVNQCEFKCHLCYKDHTTSKALSIHIANVHEITTEDYKAKYHTLMSKEVRKKCPVPSCGQTILFASFSLKSHFRADHRMKLVKCFERYVQGNKGGKGQEVKRTLSLGSRPEAKKDDNFDNQDDTNADIHKSEGFTKWKNQCEFNCQICGQVYCSGVGIGRHIKKTHDMSIDNYKKRFGSTFSKRVSDKCPVPYCQSQVLYHTYDLRAHLESKHSLGLLDCYVQYVMSKNPIPSKTDGGDESVAYDEPEQQPAQEQGDTQGQNNESTAASDLDMSLLDTDQFQKWKNQCQFDCKVCQNEYVSQLGLLLHMKQLHGLDSGEYKAQYGSLCSKLVQDKCPVLGCCKQITFHSRAIKRHMAVHSMTPEKCYLKYVVGNTERSLESPMIVPPSPGLSECSDSSRGRKKTVPVRRLSRQSEGSDLVERNKGGVRRRAYKNYRFPWNQCSRHCHVCGYKCPGYGALAQHLKTKHDLSMVSAPTYVEGDIDIQHTCLICQTNIKFSAPTVSAHMKDKHQLLMLEYEARFAQDLELVFASLDTTENAAANNADLGTIVIESVESQATHENEIVIKREVEEEEEEVSITEGFWYGQEDDEIPGVEKEVEFEVTGEEDTI